MQPVDILCLCNTHGVGGAQLNAGMLVTEFRKRGVSADLGFLMEREADSRHGPEDYFVIAQSKPASVRDWWKFLSTFRHQIVARRPKAIIGFQPAANIMGGIASRVLLKNCRMVATQRNPSDRQSTFAKWVEKLVGMTPLYSANVAVSNSVRNSFSGYPALYKQKMSVIYNATPILDHVEERKESCRKFFGLEGDDLLMGCLGRLHHQKNIEFTLSILRLIGGARLVIAGEGPEEMRIKQKASELGVEGRVFFLGALSGADITRFYRAIDVFLFPSIYEGFGRTLVEALSQGTPVVCNDIEIAREVGGTVAKYAPLEAESWKAAIRAALRDHDRRSCEERAAVFNLDVMVESYLKACGFESVESGYEKASWPEREQV